MGDAKGNIPVCAAPDLGTNAKSNESEEQGGLPSHRLAYRSIARAVEREGGGDGTRAGLRRDVVVVMVIVFFTDF